MYFIEQDIQNIHEGVFINCKTYSFEAESGSKPYEFFYRHNHIILELLAVKQGSMQLVTENKQYFLKAGDVAVINPFCLHSGKSTGEECEYICVTINLKTLLSLCGSASLKEAQEVLDEKKHFKELHLKDTPLFSLICDLETLFEKQDIVSRCQFFEKIYSLVSRLFETAEPSAERHSDTKSVDFMKKITIYISENYKENVTTKTVADAFYMTVPCFCYAFKNNFGTSFLKYLAQYRINTAIKIAPEIDGNLSSLAEAVGFLDYNYFSRTFKKQIGVSPAEYFGKRRK